MRKCDRISGNNSYKIDECVMLQERKKKLIQTTNCDDEPVVYRTTRLSTAIMSNNIAILFFLFSVLSIQRKNLNTWKHLN